MATCALTGTILTTKTRESHIVAGGATILLTLTGDTWVAAGGTFDAQRQNIINALDCTQSATNGWNAEVKAKAPVTDVVRTSATLVTITLSAQAGYNISALDEIPAPTIPSTALTGAVAIVCDRGFSVVPQPWTYYVSTAGNDSNDGLSADATTANTHKPFLTVGKTTNTGSPILPGDTVYISPGYFYSEALVPIAAIASAGTPSMWTGDPTCVQAWKDSSGVRLAPGQPWVTTRTAAEGLDTVIASTSSLIVNTTNKASGMQFRSLVLEVKQTGSANVWSGNFADGAEISFTECVCIGGRVLDLSTGAPTAARNLILRRCTLIARNVLNFSVTTAAASADANLGVLIEECLIFGGVGTIALGSNGGNIAGGISVQDCTFNAMTTSTGGVVGTTALRVSTTTPVHVGGCLVFGDAVGFNAGTSGQIVDDGYNRLILLGGGAAYTNVSQAATSLVGVALNLVLPHLVTWGLEMPRADFLGWTDAATTTQKFSAYSRTTPDFRGRTVRPWGAGASIGCWQVPDIAQDTSSAVTGGGTNSLKITGAGEVSFWIAVDAVATTISVKTKSTGYGGASYPQLIVMPNPSIGITASQTVTAADANEATITSPSFTPTAQGVVEVRLVSQSTSTTSATYFDLLTSP